MAVSLAKRQSVSLTKEAPRSTVFYVGLGWQPQAALGMSEFDLIAPAMPGFVYSEVCLVKVTQRHTLQKVKDV